VRNNARRPNYSKSQVSVQPWIAPLLESAYRRSLYRTVMGGMIYRRARGDRRGVRKEKLCGLTLAKRDTLRFNEHRGAGCKPAGALKRTVRFGNLTYSLGIEDAPLH
jgi:hypothetical protein